MEKTREEAEQNPYWLIEFLTKNGLSFGSSDIKHIGKGIDYGQNGGQVVHSLLTIEVLVPKNVTIHRIHHFICNIDGLKDPGGDPHKIPWGTTPDVDYRWGTFHKPYKTELTNDIRISVLYDNWSDIETRVGWVIVEFE